MFFYLKLRELVGKMEVKKFDLKVFSYYNNLNNLLFSPATINFNKIEGDSLFLPRLFFCTFTLLNAAREN